MQFLDICSKDEANKKEYVQNSMRAGQMHAFSVSDASIHVILPAYTAKILFHQSPTRHCDYTVTITVTM